MNTVPLTPLDARQFIQLAISALTIMPKPDAELMFRIQLEQTYPILIMGQAYSAASIIEMHDPLAYEKYFNLWLEENGFSLISFNGSLFYIQKSEETIAEERLLNRENQGADEEEEAEEDLLEINFICPCCGCKEIERVTNDARVIHMVLGWDSKNMSPIYGEPCIVDADQNAVFQCINCGHVVSFGTEHEFYDKVCQYLEDKEKK